MWKPSDFDDWTVKRLLAYAGPNLFERRTIEVDVNDYEDEWSISEFLALLRRIPKEHRESARITLDRDYDYTRFQIVYWRPETDEEICERVTHALAYVSEQDARDRAAYERLKQRFGS